jgi:hypothetical protein
MDGGTGRARAFLIMSPDTRGTASVAFSMQASLLSARLAVAISVSEAAAKAILISIGPFLGSETRHCICLNLTCRRRFGPEQPKGRGLPRPLLVKADFGRGQISVRKEPEADNSAAAANLPEM